MKISELQRVDELTFKQAVAAGLIGAASLSPTRAAIAPERPAVHAPVHAEKSFEPEPESVEPEQEPESVEQEPEQESSIHLTPQEEQWAEKIVKRYSIDDNLARLIVHLASKNSRQTFPKTRDILAVIGVESSFDPTAQSKLRTDPALGLMQVRPGKWGLNPGDLTDLEDQIKHGSDILHKYFRKLKDKEKATIAYNVGLQAYRDGKFDQRYLNKVKTEVTHYAGR